MNQYKKEAANMYHRRISLSSKLLAYAILVGLIVVTNAASEEIAKSESNPPKAFSTESSSSVISSVTNSSNSGISSTSTSSNSGSTNNSLKDEIYIDDEGIEGSGGRGEIHDDLEKDSDYSGSGFGPDDEDSGTSRISHNKNTHNKPTSTNQNQNRLDNRKDKNRKTDFVGRGPIDGSGDDGDFDDTDDDDDDDDDDIINVDEDDDVDVHIKPNTHEVEHKHDDHKHDDHDKDNNEDDDFDIDNDNDNESHFGHPTTDVGGRNDFDIHSVDPDKEDDEIYIENDKSGETNKDSKSDSNLDIEHKKPSETDTSGINEVLIMNKNEDRTTSFFAQPGILAAVIGGAVVGLLCAILVVMFIVYRMRKKDEGSYALDEPKRSPAVNSYAKSGNNREFYA